MVRPAVTDLREGRAYPADHPAGPRGSRWRRICYQVRALLDTDLQLRRALETAVEALAATRSRRKHSRSPRLGGPRSATLFRCPESTARLRWSHSLTLWFTTGLNASPRSVCAGVRLLMRLILQTPLNLTGFGGVFIDMASQCRFQGWVWQVLLTHIVPYAGVLLDRYMPLR